jgi:FAD/FMN-containing dehydrogenase
VVAGRTILAPSSGPGLPYPPEPPGSGGTVLDDASELSPTRVARHVTMRARFQDAEIAALRGELDQARRDGRPVVPSASRHSMGGQSLAEGGTALTLDQDWIELDRQKGTYRVAAGVRWSRVIRDLDSAGFSPAVMQSNNDFGVASTFSVNAHGWPVPFSGCGATVRSVRMMLADGSLVTCSRSENEALFRHAMGGYGLFGIVTELELDMVPNARLSPRFDQMRGEELGLRFARLIAEDPSVRMAYGRMDVALDRFFEDAMLVSYRPTAEQTGLPPAGGSGFVSRRARDVFRAQPGSDAAKRFRWWTEVVLLPHLAQNATRNSLMNEPVVTLDDNDPFHTDILHEYFVAPARFAEFVTACREVIPSSFQQLLNITLRYVATDADSVLAYAPEPRIAAVMLFSQEKTVRGEVDMARMTQALIERVLAIGGTYYLPYRPHARSDQFLRGYPRAADFVRAKREADPGLLFRNRFWDGYLARL